MKKLKLIYFLLAICTFSSCLDEDPQYALNSESVFLDENTAQLALLSCYGQLTTYDGFEQPDDLPKTSSTGTKTAAGFTLGPHKQKIPLLS